MRIDVVAIFFRAYLDALQQALPGEAIQSGIV